MSGSADGIHLWSQHKKKPMAVVEGAHHGSTAPGVGCTFEQEVSWVQSVASCRGTDLLVSPENHSTICSDSDSGLTPFEHWNAVGKGLFSCLRTTSRRLQIRHGDFVLSDRLNLAAMTQASVFELFTFIFLVES